MHYACTHLHITLECTALDNFTCTWCVHTDDASIAQVEHVAGVRQLVIVFDGDDAVALTLDVG